MVNKGIKKWNRVDAWVTPKTYLAVKKKMADRGIVAFSTAIREALLEWVK